MRIIKQSGGLKVQAIAGTYVISLGMDLPESECDGFLGFSIHRTDHTSGKAMFLNGMKAFAETDPGFPAGSEYSSEQHPIQSFQWADYSVQPDHRYTYRVLARKGTPQVLTTYAEVVFNITSENPETGEHAIYFNRGVAASQEYARRFGDRAPEKVAPGKGYLENPAFVWLSRGLYEAMTHFIESADPDHDSFRIAAYEFTFSPFLDTLKRAIDRGVDIQIIYDGRENSDGVPGQTNRNAVMAAGLTPFSVERTRPKSVISHNKFIVRLHDGKPVSVWTGGTNFSKGGIFGHSNAAHLIKIPEVASKYLEYWSVLKNDPEHAPLTQAVESITPLPDSSLPGKGTTAIFSPRTTLESLDLYAGYAMKARQGLMMTFAFGMNDIFKKVYQTSNAPFRLALMEQKTRPMKESPEKKTEEESIQKLRNMPQNVFAIGNFIRTNSIDGWVKERLSGLNANVRYVHDKFMLIDPLGNDPIVIAGSANFSAASILKNDENMVVVRGDKRVADIYLGEFMRLWSHHAFRESLQWRRPGDPPVKPLRTDDWWRDSFGNTERSARRQFFAP
ncbi:phospholipase D-like domain-containing protein [Pseudomonas sp. NPDC089734]|uniref:phospholipase D-like domain-containing protein n=1 Tax=Pseudomonas sp. NPDC089734 TaxID=3364469 RepID=UPI00381DB30A